MAELHFPFETIKLVDKIVDKIMESSPQTVLGYVLSSVLLLALLEQAVFTYKRIKYGLEGPTFIVPFIGGMWGSQRARADCVKPNRWGSRWNRR